jgi:hypothetical protein
VLEKTFLAGAKKAAVTILLTMLFYTSVKAEELCADTLISTPDTSILLPKKKLSFWEPAPTLNKKRMGAVLGTMGGLYGGAMLGLNHVWYAQYPRSKFHFFNDAGEWNQIDKCGHALAANFSTIYAYDMLRWSGMKRVPAAFTAGAIGFGLISSIEILDGFSAEWGASGSDLAANFLGAALATTQILLWNEQRIQLKYSLHLYDYPRGQLGERAANLYGTGFGERIIKDYNNMNFWLSFNTSSFFKSQKHAKWINISFGYGAGNLYGGFENKWEDKNGVIVDRTDVKRYRKFFISLDADLSRVKARTRAGRAVLKALNFIKLPFPAIEFNTLGQVVFHPVHFLNFSMPVYLKK